MLCVKGYMDVAAVAPKAGKSSSGVLFIVLTVKEEARNTSAQQITSCFCNTRISRYRT